jgi:hypothetical protein
MVGSCEYGTKPLTSVTSREFLDQLGYCYLLKVPVYESLNETNRHKHINTVYGADVGG